ncbi:putative aldehyde dehydrogenase [Mesorhizobium sp. SOD10]|nr:putative aldehyde dehydrogenase [Mesorhizobium sp. SOD10]
MIVSINPASGEEVASFKEHSGAEIDSALTAAVRTQLVWRARSVEDRVPLLRQMAVVLRKEKARYARLITQEMGKPLVESEAEIEKCAWNCDFYAENAARFLADEFIESSATESHAVFDPLGIVLAIMPWNYPFWQFFRFAAPALAAGNGAILKHANNVPQCALAIEEVMTAAGCPDGLFRTLMIQPDMVAGLISDDRIAAVTLTGSTQVGAIVAAQAGKALKKQVLELGGSDPFVVLADADVEAAAATAVKARFINVGQSCVNAKRFIVDKGVADAFVQAFRRGIERLKVGDPLDPQTSIGPLARANLRVALHKQVERSLAAGARLEIGGKAIEGPGYYYAPTILDHVTPGMAAFDEETFGPVAAIVRVENADEAITLANQTEYGLGAAIWTSDLGRARQLARRIDAGAVFINGMVASDPRLPFGGIKRSGYGRELGVYGIREFVNIKTMWIGPSRNAAPASKSE